jgi:hypothetical protein
MIDAFIYLIVALVIIGVLLALLFYVCDNLLPAPINKIVKVAGVVAACIAVILILLKMFGIADVDVPQVQG